MTAFWNEDMIDIAPFLNGHYANIIGATERFLSSRGASSSDYIVTSQPLIGKYLFAIQYDDARFEDGDYHARILISNQAGVVLIDTGLRMALGILRSAFDSDDTLEATRSLASSGSSALGQVDARDLAPDVHSSGLFVNVDSSPARLENIEVNGDRSTLAVSTSFGALNYTIAMIQYQTRERVGQRFSGLL